jgi:hypothetical protein
MTGGPYPSRVTRDILLVLISGGLALGGIVIGHLLTARTSRAAEIDRREAEDARRWRSDRRAIYAKYLGLASVMLRDIDGIGCLPYDGSQSLSAEDDEAIRELLFEYIVDWNEDLQPALGEVQLLASPEVADLADRVSGALLDLTSEIEKRGIFINHYPTWFQTQDLLEVLRQAMRQELGVSGELEPHGSFADWPWLPDRPPRSSYVQKNPSSRDRPSAIPPS